MNEMNPSVSIIIPVYNDPEGLKTTVRSLLNQSFSDYEVIIADNGSTDSTYTVAKRYARRDDVAHIIEDRYQSSYAARNAGIEAANGRILAFIDADMWVKNDYVQSIYSKMEKNNRMYMGCNVEIVINDKTSTGRFNAATGFPIQRYIKEMCFAPTCCLVINKRLIEDVGDFDHRLVSGGDLEFGHRVASAGYELIFEPDIVLYHPARNTIQKLISKNIRVGRGQEQLRHYYPSRFGHRSIWNPRNFLPLYPSTFMDNLQKEPESTIELVFWYLLAYITKLSSTEGRIKQRYSFRSH